MARIIVLLTTILYSLFVLVGSAPVVFSQDRYGILAQRITVTETKISAIEKAADAMLSQHLAERLAVLEQSTAHMADELTWISRMAFATLIGVLAFLIKEATAVLRARKTP